MPSGRQLAQQQRRRRPGQKEKALLDARCSALGGTGCLPRTGEPIPECGGDSREAHQPVDGGPRPHRGRDQISREQQQEHQQDRHRQQEARVAAARRKSRDADQEQQSRAQQAPGGAADEIGPRRPDGQTPEICRLSRSGRTDGSPRDGERRDGDSRHREDGREEVRIRHQAGDPGRAGCQPSGRPVLSGGQEETERPRTVRGRHRGDEKHRSPTRPHARPEDAHEAVELLQRRPGVLPRLCRQAEGAVAAGALHVPWVDGHDVARLDQPQCKARQGVSIGGDPVRPLGRAPQERCAHAAGRDTATAVHHRQEQLVAAGSVPGDRGTDAPPRPRQQRAQPAAGGSRVRSWQAGSPTGEQSSRSRPRRPGQPDPRGGREPPRGDRQWPAGRSHDPHACSQGQTGARQVGMARDRRDIHPSHGALPRQRSQVGVL